MTIKLNRSTYDGNDTTDLQERREARVVRRIGPTDSQLFPGWGPRI